MDVNQTSFYPLLLDILTDISESHFVAFDLELSGVPVKQSGASRRVGKPSLQERYQEVKEAAEKYVILQLGLTCVREDVETGKYVCKPYNFEISPLVEVPGLDVERDFAFSSSAVDFLKRVGFDFTKPFNVGVPYLSREESKQAREKHDNRQKKDAIADLQIKETDSESLALLQRVRDEVKAWLDMGNAASDYCNIGPVGSDTLNGGEASAEFTRYEKRLVHQLVRAEYPQLVTISRRGFVQVVRFDAEREARVLAERKAELNERISRQKGFRWIIEALLGNDISNVDLRMCATDPLTGEHVFADMHEYSARFHRAQHAMRNRPRVMVGHNCFLDLVYLYKTFVGRLPETVTEFAREINKRWPVIVDTKYMATHNCGDINPASSLEEIARQLEYQEKQVDELDELHSKYKNVEVYHEAGFDSFLTAQVAVRLSMKLEREGAYVDDLEEGGVKINGPSAVVGTAVGKGKGLLSVAFSALSMNGVANEPPPPTPPSAAPAPINAWSNGPPNPATPKAKQAPRANSPQLSLSPRAEAFVPSSLGGSWKRGGDPTLGPVAADDPFNPQNFTKQRQVAEGPGISDGMPRFSGDFWRVYGNRLRVFGTEEGVCALGEGA